MKRFKFINKLLIAIILLFTCTSCQEPLKDEGLNKEKSQSYIVESLEEDKSNSLQEDKYYYSKEDVADYIHTYGKLPSNYITKKQAQKMGWNPKEANLWDIKEGAVIGGDYFGNYEELLPENEYKEADVNYDGGHRNAERLVFDEDGNIYYTKDHYESFERIY